MFIVAGCSKNASWILDQLAATVAMQKLLFILLDVQTVGTSVSSRITDSGNDFVFESMSHAFVALE